jgi:glutaminyl-peptide cyclotransferase
MRTVFRRIRIVAVVRVACFAALVLAPATVRAQTCGDPQRLRFETTRKIVRSELGFTQGFEFHAGKLYESTGAIGGSTRLNTIALDGTVTRLADQGTTVFGEGLTILNDEIFQLTWTEHQVFVYDLSGKLKRKMRNPRDGWGLTNDGQNLLFTDGGGSIHEADPKTFRLGKESKIRASFTRDVNAVNELEFAGGKLYGNIFTTQMIVRIDPKTACVDAIADLSPLIARMPADEKAQLAADTNNVANGIAHDAASGLFYLTGKRWKAIYVGRFVDAAQ